MRQFANYIHIAPAFRVSSVTGSTVVMKSGFTQDRFICQNEVEPVEEPDRKAAGILYNFKVSVAVEKLTDAQMKVYGNDAPVILTLLDVETVDRVIVGTKKMPASISVTSGTNHDILTIQYSSKTTVL
jgi:hypothetical protein